MLRHPESMPARRLRARELRLGEKPSGRWARLAYSPLLLLAAATVPLGSGVGAAGRHAPAHRPSTAAILQSLAGRMPTSFDFYVEDACTGGWMATLPGEGGVLHLTILRYKGVPLVHLQGSTQQTNVVWSPVGPQSIRFESGQITSVMTCSPGSAVLADSIMIDGQTRTFNVDVRSDTAGTPQ